MTDDPAHRTLRKAAEKIAEEEQAFLTEAELLDLLRLSRELETVQIDLEARNEELTRTARELETARNEYYDLYESAPVAFVSLNPKGLIEKANAAALNMLPAAKREVLGSGFSNWIQPEDWGVYFRRMKMAAVSHRSGSFEIRLVGGRASPRVVYIQAAPKVLPEEGFCGWRLAFFDITEKKRLEQELRVSREQLALATEAGGIGVWNYDLQSRTSHWNEHLYRLLGLPARQGLEPENRFFDFILPEDRKGVLHNIQAVVEGGDEIDLEFRILRADNGEVRWLAAKGAVTYDAKGRALRVQGVNFDITDRKQSELALRESREQFRSVLEHSLDIAFRRNVQSEHFDYLSPAIEQITGFPPAELLSLNNRELLELVHAEDRTRVTAEVEKAHRRGAGKLEFRFRTKDGGHLWMSDHFTVRYDADGRPLHRIGVMRDISEEKDAEKTLVHHQRMLSEKLAELEGSNRELSEYAYAVSHDLKAPLRAVRNYVDFLSEDLDGRLSGEQKTYLEGMKKAVSQGNTLIRDLLELSRIGQAPQPPETVDLDELVSEIRAEIRADERHAETDQVTVRSNCGRLYADRLLLRTILNNLIENGLKFNKSEVKRVEIRCRPAPGGRIELLVEDNGIGIEKRYREKIFQVFQRLHPDSAFKGTGIGLAIVRKATGQLAGSVRLESTPGEGSRFIVDLPRTPPGLEGTANQAGA